METPINHARWLLQALARRSPKPISKMEPTHTLTGALELDDLDIRSLTGSMRVYIKKRNPSASLAKAEVEKTKNVRGEEKLLVKKIDDADLTDADADAAITEAKRELADEK